MFQSELSLLERIKVDMTGTANVVLCNYVVPFSRLRLCHNVKICHPERSEGSLC